MFQEETDAPVLRGGVAGPHITGFKRYLEEQGYARSSTEARGRAAAHLGHWMERNSLKLEDLTEPILESFERHLPRCRCLGTKPRYRRQVMAGTRLFIEYLRCQGLVAPAPSILDSQRQPPLIEAFRRWMFQHRGIKTRTLDQYCRVIDDLLQTVGEDVARFDTAALRRFVVERGRPHSRGQAQNIATAVRVFLRYLVATGQCSGALDGAIPPVPSWRLSALPRYLVASDVDRLLATCAPNTPRGLRDRAILLLLCRLGLRAQEVVDLRLSDIDWQEASLAIAGKGRRCDRLPLTQEVGDAILAYLERGRPAFGGDAVFLRTRAPRRPFQWSTAVSGVVRRAIRRAGVIAPSHGAHVLRHSAATQMLGQGSSLEAIAKLLRHRSLETTAYYAKVDIALLKELAQPWPEVMSC